MCCIVCGRAKSQHLKVSVVEIDGVKCRVCEECAKDQFRRPMAVAKTTGQPRLCDCEACKLRENGGGQTASHPVDGGVVA